MFFANFNFINLNRDHKNISFTYKRSFKEILDVNKFVNRLRCETIQGEIAEITHPIFDQDIRCNFHSNINHNLQPHKSNMRNFNFCWINFVMSVIFLKQAMSKYHRISLNSQFTVVLDSIICFSVRFCNKLPVVLKMYFQVFSFARRKVQGFSCDKEILMLLLSVLFHLQNCVLFF